MRILYIVWNYYPNTAYTNHTKATVKGMKECGCKVDVLSIKPVLSNEPYCIKGQRSVADNSFINTAISTLIDIWTLIRSIKKYDVIYCACPESHIVRLSLKCARKQGKPIVHERTEFPDIFYSKSPRAQRSLNKYLHCIAKYDKLFVISNPIKEYFIENGVPETKIHIYPMIVDPNRFASISKVDVGFRYMAYCGNLSNSKDGVAVLIEAYGKSRAKTTLRLMLIGSKPLVEEQAIYNELIDKYSLNEKVIFRGEVSRDEMPKILTNADVLLLCRPNNRQALGGFPTKLGEYLSTGNPVLITRVGDIDKYIIDGENGYISSPDNVDEFASKMDYIIDNYDKAREVGTRGKSLANEAFHYGIQTKKVVDVLEQLI